jgi:predicted acylesterase/phospholipase RssA
MSTESQNQDTSRELPRTSSLFERIQSLGLPQGEYIVVGSSILELKGIRKANDIDILVKREVFDAFKKDTSWQLIENKKLPSGIYEYLRKDEIEICYYFYHDNTTYGLEYFMEDSSRTEIINGIYFVSLTDLIRSKSLWHRDKDLKDVKLIEEYLTSEVL